MKQFYSIIILLSLLLFSGNSIILFPQKSGEMNKRGVDFGKSKEFDKAIKEFNRAIEIRDRSAAIVYHNKAYALEKRGDFKGAIENYEEAWKRNPKQIVSGERLGFTYYRIEDYENAVRVGEAVLKLDPENKEVPKWLADAYDKRLAKRQERMLAEKKRMEEEARRRAEEAERKRLEEQKKRKMQQILYFSIDAMMRTGYYLGQDKEFYGVSYGKDKKTYIFMTDKGLIVDIPETIFFQFTPIKWLQFDLTLEKPFLGALSPNLIEHSETIEILFRFKKYMLGAGFMFNHYDSDISWYRRYKLWDFKIGFIFGYKKDKYEAKFRWYPRMLLLDMKSCAGKTLDVGILRIDYSYYIKSYVKFNFLIYARDYYVFCHSFDSFLYLRSSILYYKTPYDNMANYWGVYDVGFSITLGEPLYHPDSLNLLFTIELIERFYLRDMENTKPYTLTPNGQGIFGLNTKKWTKGKPFSGFRALSHVLGFKLEEKINRYIFLYQKLIIELADQNEDHHEFNLQAGFGVKY